MPSIISNNKAKKYGKIGIAKANTVSFNVEGVYEEDRQRFIAMASALNITFSGNAVAINGVDIRFDALEADQHNHSNKTVLDGTTASYTTEEADKVATINVGGDTLGRPTTPVNFQMYFDTDLNKPIWYNGTDWVDATGTIV